MKADHNISWPNQALADDHAMVGRVGEISVIFGLGPAKGTSPPVARMERVLDALRPEVRAIRWGEQIHGRVIASLASEAGHELSGAVCVGRCDGLMTADPGVGLAIWTADCVPVLMVGDEVIAAVHAGWRGAADDIVGAAVKRFRIEYGVPAAQIRAFLGPSISGPRYEVGQEVIDALQHHAVNQSRWRDGKHVDLRAFLVGRLRDLGLEKAAVSSIGPCTAGSAKLASFRRDASAAGRQFSLVYRSLS